MKYLKRHIEFINEARRLPQGDKWVHTGPKEVRMGYFERLRKGMDPNQPHVKNSAMRIDDTVKYQVLKFVYKAGYDGVRYTDMVKYIMEVIREEHYDYKKHRGMYSVLLQDVRSYLSKKDNGRYYLDNDKLIEHFDELKEKGILDEDWYKRSMKKQGFKEDDINMMSDILGVNNKNVDDW